MTPEKLANVQTVVVHDNCPDGLGAAIILRDAFFGRDIEIVFVQHNTDKYNTLAAKPGMLFADITPPPARTQEFVDAGAIVLDHHKKAEATVRAFGENGIFADEVKDPGVSGTTLAFTHVWLPLRGDLAVQRIFADRFARLAGIRDTWQRTSEDWKEACMQAEVLMFLPRERWLSTTLTDIAARWGRDYRWIGEMLVERIDSSMKRLLDHVYRFSTTNGTRVAVLNSLKTSDLADVVEDNIDILIGFSYLTETVGETQTRKLVLSTRSRGKYNCMQFCSTYGGGGHTNAAGCSVPIVSIADDPYTVIANMLNDYEGGKS